MGFNAEGQGFLLSTGCWAGEIACEALVFSNERITFNKVGERGVRIGVPKRLPVIVYRGRTFI